MGAVQSNKLRAAALATGLSILPLTIAIMVTLILTIYPIILTNEFGQADHRAAILAFWAMSAGYIRGVGFIPINRGLRMLFSTPACVMAILSSAALMACHGMKV